MLTSRARLSVGVFSLGVHRLTCRRKRGVREVILSVRVVIKHHLLYTTLSHHSFVIDRHREKKPVITHQEPDAKLTEEPLVVLVVLFVIKLDVVQRVVRGGQAHLTTSVHLKLTLFCMYFCLFEKAGWIWRGGERQQRGREDMRESY